jgi:pantetheine-phosphate adenylyltransferase
VYLLPARILAGNKGLFHTIIEPRRGASRLREARGRRDLYQEDGKSAVHESPAGPRIAVYTGSFDPITLGHLDVIERASRIFDRIVVGVGINPDKQPLFSLEERVRLVRESLDGLGNVAVELFSGLSVAFVREQGAHVLLRGVRSLTDIEAEFTMTLANRRLDAGVETVFLMADAAYSHISSSLLKQITPLADDEALLKFVPAPVVEALRRRFADD